MKDNENIYRDYLKCWKTFLGHIHGMYLNESFSLSLLVELRKIHPAAEVRKWSGVWPNVDWLFDSGSGDTMNFHGMENFVRCVRAAEEKSCFENQRPQENFRVIHA